MEINNEKNRIQKNVQFGYNFDMEKYFRDGWDIFRKSPGPIVLYTVIFGAIYLGLAFIPFIGALALTAIGPALAAGYFVAFKKLETSESIEIGDFFKSFDFILHLFLVGLVGGLLAGIGFILLVIPGIWFSVAIGFASLFVVFAGMEFWDAIETSVKVINKKWFHFFAMFLLLFILNFFGALLLGLGLLITIPVTYAVIYASYRDIIGVSGPQKDYSPEDHLVG